MLHSLVSSILANWPTTLQEARAVQLQLREKLVLKNSFSALQTIAGIDVSYDTKSNISYAVVVWMNMADLKPLVTASAQMPTTFPYVPGFLSFREIPVLLKALEQLPEMPDILMVDGQGIAHPRRLGIAAHLGVLLNMPSLGVAKSRLIGTYREPGNYKGDISPLYDKEEKIGTVLRSKEKTKPLFISPGHRLDQETAVEITLQCLTRYRLPEPTRLADKISKTIKLPASGIPGL